MEEAPEPESGIGMEEPEKSTAAIEEPVIIVEPNDTNNAATEGQLEQAPEAPGSNISVSNSSNVVMGVGYDEVSESEPPIKKNNASASQMPQQEPSSITNKKTLMWSFLALLVIVGIILAVTLTSKSPDEPDVGDPPIGVDFSTGVSLITSYAIDAKIRSRLARTTIKMEVANALPCSSIHVISLQLPLNTRITNLTTTSDDGCTSKGDVQELREARETFMDSASKGVPGAYVEAREDSFTHSLQVAIPPLGTSNVELTLEQLLQQRLGEVQFEVPLAPNEKVDSITFDLSVENTGGEPVDFHVDLNVPGVYEPSFEDDNVTVSAATQTIHREIPDARQYNIPKVIRGRYDPGELPENGLLFTDGRCFEHFFHPLSLAPMPRNFHFVIDTSGSMNSYSKLHHAKKAITMFIDSLKPEDTFTIQAFGNSGTEEMWGSGPGTPEEKEEAKKFVDSLTAHSHRTDLHEALLLGLLRAKDDAKKNEGNMANVLVLLSDGYATRGEQNRTKIAEHVYELNEDGMVKIFSLGFQGSADMELLDAIALMNGGVSAPLLRGHEDYAKQITQFLESELGSVLMSDVNVKYSTGASKNKDVFGETQTLFPVLADGYEVVVRGLVGGFDGEKKLNAITSASTVDGPKDWALSVGPTSDDTVKSSLCFQSYAHERITQLIRYYDASNFLGDDLIKRLVKLSNNECTEDKFAKCVRAEALALAKEANVVAKGLTAMVTVDDEKCMKLDEEAEICIDGTTPDPDSKPPDREDDYGYDSYATGAASESEEPYYGYEEDEGYYYRDPPSGAFCHGYGWASLIVILFSSWYFAVILEICL